MRQNLYACIFKVYVNLTSGSPAAGPYRLPIYKTRPYLAADEKHLKIAQIATIKCFYTCYRQY